MRVFELARELNVPAEALVHLLREMDVPTRSHMSQVADHHAARVRTWVERERRLGHREVGEAVEAAISEVASASRRRRRQVPLAAEPGPRAEVANLAGHEPSPAPGPANAARPEATTPTSAAADGGATGTSAVEPVESAAAAGATAGPALAQRLAPPDTRTLPDLLRQAATRLAALQVRAREMWVALLDCEDANAATELENQIRRVEEEQRRLAGMLEMRMRLALVEQEALAAHAASASAREAGDFPRALEFRKQERSHRALYAHLAEAARRVLLAQERVATLAEDDAEAAHRSGGGPDAQVAEMLRAQLDGALVEWEDLVRDPAFVALREAAATRSTPSGPTTPAAEPVADPTVETETSRSIFISYHRSPEIGHVAGRIYDRLVTEFGRDVVFRDLDSIPLGVDFKQHLDDAVKGSAVVLAVIWGEWHQRMQNPRDFVRIELEAALRRSIPIIPLFVGNVTMPAEDDLPPALQPLVYRNGAPVRADPDFYTDMNRLVRALRELLPTR